MLTARRTFAASALVVDNRFDSYKLHKERLLRQIRMAIAKNAKLERLDPCWQKTVRSSPSCRTERSAGPPIQRNHQQRDIDEHQSANASS